MSGPGRAACLLWCLVAAVAAQQAAAPVATKEDVHVVFLTDCSSYSDWQTLGMVFSWRESGQVGADTFAHAALAHMSKWRQLTAVRSALLSCRAAASAWIGCNCCNCHVLAPRPVLPAARPHQQGHVLHA